MFLTWPAPDFYALHRGLAEHWGPHEENTARLMEIRAYSLDLQWSDRIVDPNDPEVAAERKRLRRAGITPPRHPLVPPVAYRPAWLARERAETYEAALAEWQPPLRVPSLEEWERAAGITD